MADKEPPILPSAADVIGAGKARLVEVRPRAEPHLETGRYGTVFEGLLGQFTLARARLAEEVRASFLRSSEDEALAQLAASRFDTPRAAETPIAAVGAVTLTRDVVHFLPSTSLTITAADATTATTLTALLTAIYETFNEHAASVYEAGTGLGAHRVADSDLLPAPVTATMGDLVSTLNYYKTHVNAHFARAFNIFGAVLGVTYPHLASDVDNRILVDDAFADDGALAFSAQGEASQASALLLANAIKSSLLAHMGLRALAGTIRTGTRFRVEADATRVPPIPGGEFEVTQHAYARTGSESVTATVRAVTPGPDGNLPTFLAEVPSDNPFRATVIGVKEPTIKLQGSLYDAKETLRWSPSTIRSAGGTLRQADPPLREAARRYWQGSYGPTDAALIAGALRFPGLARVMLLKNTDTGTSHAYAVDESWSQSAPWLDALTQHLKNNWLGFGCRMATGTVHNRVVRIELTVVLRQRSDLADTTAIHEALRLKLHEYFDERPDWWTFRLAGLRGVLSRAHAKVLRCAEATVLDVDGVPLEEPAAPAAGDALVHWWFADGLDVVFDAPEA